MKSSVRGTRRGQTLCNGVLAFLIPGGFARHGDDGKEGFWVYNELLGWTD